MKSEFDYIVIGKGLVGSAVAKHLSYSSSNVAIIGPDEPQQNENSIVYASHYDQARVQRIIGKDEIWTKLNHAAANEYERIERESGIKFHGPVGSLYIYPYGEDQYLKEFPAYAKKYGIQYDTYQKEAFPYFNFPEKSMGIFEHAPSGFIEPRKIIPAQLKILEKNSGQVFRDTVIKLTFSDNRFTLETNSHQTLHSKKVIVSTGSFANHLNILPRKLKLRTKSEVVLLVKVDESTAQYLSSLPSLLYEIDEGETEGVYMIQPLKYPDGNYYLKIGCNSPHDKYFDSLEQIQEWFRTTNSESFAPPLLAILNKIFPSFTIGEYLTKKCIMSRTEHGRPYIGETITLGLFIAGGCHGHSAMASDGMGSVAAHLALNGSLPDGYPKDAFEIKYDDTLC